MKYIFSAKLDPLTMFSAKKYFSDTSFCDFLKKNPKFGKIQFFEKPQKNAF
jgi:hypothetical protein